MDWFAAYSEAVSVADDLGELVDAIEHDELTADEWAYNITARARRWRAWREVRPPAGPLRGPG